MITIYDLLEVDEKASKEEIEKSYERLILKYHKDPNLDEEANKDNEIILNKLKIAYEIISDDEKRKKYDKDLANKRAENLINSISAQTTISRQKEENSLKQNENKENEKDEKLKETNKKQNEKDEKIKETNEKYNENKKSLTDNNGILLNKKEKKEIKKAAQQEFNENLKKAQIAEEEYKKAYNEAYNNYLRKMGYKVKEPWTLKRVKNLLITIFAIVLVCALIWTIPATRNILKNIYETNFIIKSLVDIFVMILNAILNIFK